MAKYDITNPTLARRVIFDGLANQRKIVVEPGETKVGVELSEDVASKFGDGSDGNRWNLFVKLSVIQTVDVVAEVPFTGKVKPVKKVRAA